MFVYYLASLVVLLVIGFGSEGVGKTSDPPFGFDKGRIDWMVRPYKTPSNSFGN